MCERPRDFNQVTSREQMAASIEMQWDRATKKHTRYKEMIRKAMRSHTRTDMLTTLTAILKEEQMVVWGNVHFKLSLPSTWCGDEKETEEVLLQVCKRMLKLDICLPGGQGRLTTPNDRVSYSDPSVWARYTIGTQQYFFEEFADLLLLFLDATIGNICSSGDQHGWCFSVSSDDKRRNVVIPWFSGKPKDLSVTVGLEQEQETPVQATLRG
eukprot:TRINITY_DN356_c0_g1_i1.p1 TRINITY_DN356_c0_g1~~TRINITY_DN356_c0_g1_i1.p1  ORF type:complete len:212 (+),score=4.57 TRINITY_DN356_c0_g1_i1:56-691(+)